MLAQLKRGAEHAMHDVILMKEKIKQYQVKLNARKRQSGIQNTTHYHNFYSETDSDGAIRKIRVPDDPPVVVNACGVNWNPTYRGDLFCGKDR